MSELYWSVARGVRGEWRLRMGYALREDAFQVGARLVACGNYAEQLVFRGTREDVKERVRAMNEEAKDG